tara:strand:- start:124 stop:915 length:792 start_codon:yes stop_codon:yes gene_type:complete
VGTEVKMNDKIETLKGSVTIIFVDETKVNISEYSKLIIDEFVYDANSNTGKINLKAGLGKLRYTSGLMANKENIKISTPTASVSVRGTDFEANVNEAGASTFTLLPSIASDGSTYVGVIEVFNATGAVVLDTAFEVTTVTSSYTPPTPPVINRNRLEKAIEARDNNDKDIEKIDDVDDEELDVETDKDALDETLIKVLEDENNKNLFYEEDDKAIFESVDGENKVKLIVNKETNVSLKYDNKGVITEGNHNSGGNVIINIIQQ